MQKKTWIRYVMILVLLLTSGVIYSCQGKDQEEAGFAGESLFRKETVSSPAESETSSLVIYVHVCGCVLYPGVYPLPEGSRVYQAVEAAGGFTDDAAYEEVNLAANVSDAMQIRIYSREESKTLEQIVAVAEDNGLVNLNSADYEALMSLPGIGEVKARAILLYREQYGRFHTKEDLMNVPGIKESVYEKVKERITV